MEIIFIKKLKNVPPLTVIQLIIHLF